MRRLLLLLAAALLLIALAFTYLPKRAKEPTSSAHSMGVAEALGAAETEGYATAQRHRPFRFPRDHGPHPDFRSEWWYLTGNLITAEGQRLGFQFTLFRSALSPNPTPEDSPWRTRQFYMGHLALTDVAAGRHYAFERFARAAVGLAGAEPLRLWLEDWRLTAESDGGLFPARLQAAQGEIALDLRLVAEKPPVPQGVDGFSRKGDRPGNASYYYSLPRLAVSGEVVVEGRRRPVAGLAWMDREWGTTALEPGIEGWDWFALQLSGGGELMFYRLRTAAGGASPWSAGALIDSAGRGQPLSADALNIVPLDQWRSPATGVRYPSGWLLEAPKADLRLKVTPLLADQELKLSVRYWEGAVLVEGRRGGESVEGQGYVELTGYGERREVRPGG